MSNIPAKLDREIEKQRLVVSELIQIRKEAAWDVTINQLAINALTVECKRLEAQNAELVAACKWILQDLAYKAPELIASEIKMRYARRLLGAIGREKAEP